MNIWPTPKTRARSKNRKNYCHFWQTGELADSSGETHVACGNLFSGNRHSSARNEVAIKCLKVKNQIEIDEQRRG